MFLVHDNEWKYDSVLWSRPGLGGRTVGLGHDMRIELDRCFGSLLGFANRLCSLVAT